jgi:hypothetical protein
MENPPEEHLSSDVQAFCQLVSRIILRCLREHDERALQILGLSSVSTNQPQKGATDGKESAA